MTLTPGKTTRQPREHMPSAALGWQLAGWAVALVACLGVFALYLKPDFLLTLADQLWACF